eukprot:1141997-Pelagomonas_calceolata.AAC.8
MQPSFFQRPKRLRDRDSKAFQNNESFGHSCDSGCTPEIICDSLEKCDLPLAFAESVDAREMSVLDKMWSSAHASNIYHHLMEVTRRGLGYPSHAVTASMLLLELQRDESDTWTEHQVAPNRGAEAPPQGLHNNPKISDP